MHKPFVYFGTPYVARDTLAILVERGFVPSLVVTSPDAPRGRGLVLTPSETKAWALEHDIPVLAPAKLDTETIEAIKVYGCEYAIVVAYGKILPSTLIDAFPLGILNIHYSLLPKYRGASPVEAALLNGESVTGVSVQKMVPELDAGDVLIQKQVTIDESETTRELRPRLVAVGADMLATILPEFERGMNAVPQEHSAATFAKKIRKEEGELTVPGDDLLNWRKYRAYSEGPGTYFFHDKDGRRMRVKIVSARFVDGRFVPERVVPEGKKEMAYEDFVR
ncbi:MAG TPA: methionyl-tRNA formyltransferase [Candidatus Paceibacterota bacterium]|nr:methionyl-tRNA formyltransferase [Candidatus Paceibacterota bacterium]